MKKIIVFVSAAAMLLTLAACGSTGSSSSSVPAEPSSVSQPAPVSQPSSDSQSSTGSGSSEALTENMVEGTITDASMNNITIKTADGATLSFGTEDADKTAANGLLVDSNVKIYYTGAITGEDTAQAVVTSLEQEASALPDSTSAAELTPASETSSAAK